MGNMFSNYTNLNPLYTPNNTEEKLPTNNILVTSLPRKQTNIKGDVVALEWDYGDNFILTFPINKTIKVEEDALIYEETGEQPTSETIGIFGQKAYNVIDEKCWVCNTLDRTIYEWIEIIPFEYPKDGTKEVTLITEVDLENITIKLTVYNNVFQIIYEEDVTGQDIIALHIEGDLATKLVKGLYYCYVQIHTPSNIFMCNKVLLNVL